MCDFSNVDPDTPFGFIVDTPEIRGLIDETRRLMAEIDSDAARVKALEPAFARLLAADGWLPEEYASPDETSGMGGGIGSAIGGLGATTGVAWLRIFFGEAAPSSSLGASCSGAGICSASIASSGGGGGSVTSKISTTSSGSRSRTGGDRFTRAKTRPTCSSATSDRVAARSRRLSCGWYMGSQRYRNARGFVTLAVPGGEAGLPGGPVRRLP